MNTKSEIPLSLYIHIPWCIKKCPYCDFNSHALKHELPEADYIAALIDDLSHHLPDIEGREIQTIFIGGGTPSLFSAAAYQTLFTFIREHCNLNANAEITLEANPGTIDEVHFAGYIEAGINRLSLGVQSFQDSMLQKLGRIHSSETAMHAINVAKKTGFTNINVDLMYGLPEQTPEMAVNDIEQALAFAPQHISWYQLTLEPNTFFYKHPPTLPSNDSLHTIEDAVYPLLQKNHYERYEISAYSQSTLQCKHNLNYWLFGDYLGIGAGAHSKLTMPDGIARYVKQKQPKSYIKSQSHCEEGEARRSNPYILSQSTIPEDQRIFEFMLNALRLYRWIPFDLFELHAQLSRESLMPLLGDASCFEYNDDCFRLTEHGARFYNDIVSRFL